MRAMVLHEIAAIESSPLVWTERPAPEPAADEVRVRVRCCAICRTDLHVIEGDLPRHTLPIVPGHQVVGTIDAVGPGCDSFRAGQRVGIAWLRATCGACRYCTARRENLCPDACFTGYHADGGYAEYAVVPAAFAYPLPDAFEDAAAAPLLCAGIIGYRAMKRCGVRPGERLALYGFGSSAHVVLQLAVARGCEVYVVSRTGSHRALAVSLGAAWTGADARAMPAKADRAIIFAPAGHVVPLALEQLERGGTLALAGVYMSDVPPLNYERHLFYEREVHSVTSNTRADAIELLAEAAAVGVRPHVVSYDIRDANRALQDLKADRIQGTGVLVAP